MTYMFMGCVIALGACTIAVIVMSARIIGYNATLLNARNTIERLKADLKEMTRIWSSSANRVQRLIAQVKSLGATPVE